MDRSDGASQKSKERRLSAAALAEIRTLGAEIAAEMPAGTVDFEVVKHLYAADTDAKFAILAVALATARP